jgi:hypothetical protein
MSSRRMKRDWLTEAEEVIQASQSINVLQGWRHALWFVAARAANNGDTETHRFASRLWRAARVREDRIERGYVQKGARYGEQTLRAI